MYHLSSSVYFLVVCLTAMVNFSAETTVYDELNPGLSDSTVNTGALTEADLEYMSRLYQRALENRRMGNPASRNLPTVIIVEEDTVKRPGPARVRSRLRLPIIGKRARIRLPIMGKRADDYDPDNYDPSPVPYEFVMTKRQTNYKPCVFKYCDFKK